MMAEVAGMKAKRQHFYEEEKQIVEKKRKYEEPETAGEGSSERLSEVSKAKPFACPNPQCGKRYAARQNLFRHCRTSKDVACIYKNSRQVSASDNFLKPSSLPPSSPNNGIVNTCTPISDENCKTIPVYDIAEVKELRCTLCDRTYFSIKRFSNHLKVCTEDNIIQTENRIQCNVSDCGARFYRYTELLIHLKSIHKYKYTKLEYMFQNRAQFLAWIGEHQLDTYVCSIKRGQKKNKKDGTLYYYFACQYDAARFYQPCTKKKRGPIPSGFCPARMSIIEDTNGTLFVTHHSIHSHPVSFKNVKFQRIPKEILEYVKRQLSLGVDCDFIYKSVRNMGRVRMEREEGERMNVLTAYKKRHVSMMKYRQNKLTYAHPNDAISVFIKATAIYKNDIFVYKPQGYATVIGHGNESNVDSLNRSNTLFAFGYMNDEMYAQIQRLGNRPICIDFTHGTNQYDFYLLVFHIPDEYGKGYLAGFMLCNYTDQKTLTALLTCLKNRRPNLTVNVFITDDDRALYRSILTVFAQPSREIVHLLCLWHVDRNFQKNLKRMVKKGPKRQYLYNLLHKMTYTRSLQQFEELEQRLDEYCSSKDVSSVGGRRFLKYYKEHYAPKHGKWAMCQRRFFHFGCETNMYVETFFNFLKSHVFRRRMPGRADVLFEHLVEINREQTENLKFKIAIEEPTTQDRSGSELHHERGMKIPLSFITQSNDSLWRVRSSQQEGVYYDVTRINGRCVIPNRCGRVCAENLCIDLCICMYQCTCPDLAALCKHVHKVHSIFRLPTDSPLIAPVYPITDHAACPDYYILNTECEIPKQYRKCTMNLLITEYDKLGKFISRLNRHTSTDENARLANILNAVRQCNILFQGYFGGEAVPDAIEVSLPLPKKRYPNAKIPKQLRLFRTSKLRKKKKKAFGQDEMSRRAFEEDEVSGTIKSEYDESISMLYRLIATKTTTAPFLQCGDKIGKPVFVKGVKCVIKNSSAFDALFHIIYAAHRDSRIYEKYITERVADIPLFQLVQRTALEHSLLSETYELRASMLKNIIGLPHQTTDNNTFIIDTTFMTMNDVISSLLKVAPSYEEICISCRCDDDPQCSRKCMTKIINEITELSGSYTFPSPNDFTCPKCFHLTSPIDMDVQLSPHVFIELVKRHPVVLSSIPTTVYINTNEYLLRGIVGAHQTELGHHIAYCHRPLHWQLFDSCSANRVVAIKDDIMVECEIILYTITDKKVKNSIVDPPKSMSTTTHDKITLSTFQQKKYPEQSKYNDQNNKRNEPRERNEIQLLTPALTEKTRKLLNEPIFYKNIMHKQIGITLLEAKSLDPYLSQADLDFIRGFEPSFIRGWLYGSVIDAFYAHLLIRHTTNCFAASTMFTSLFPRIENMDILKRRVLSWDYNCIGQKEIVLCPINCNNNHWILIVLKIPQRKAFVLDPLHNTTAPDPQKFEILCHTAQKFIKQWSEIFELPSFKISYPPHIIQEDLMSCGVFVCYYGERIITNSSLCDSLHVNQYRKNIYKMITENTILEDEEDPTVPVADDMHHKLSQNFESSKELPKLLVQANMRSGSSNEFWLPLLKNGNLFSKAISISSNCNVSLKNTSSFDALFQIMLAAAIDSHSYGEFLGNINSHSEFETLVSYSARAKITQLVYKSRAKLLLNMEYVFENYNQNITLDMEKYTVADLIQSFKPSFSGKEFFLPGSCNCLQTTDPEEELNYIERFITCYHVRMTNTDDILQGLKTLLEDKLFPPDFTCIYCQDKISGVEIMYGEHIFIHLYNTSSVENCEPHSIRAPLSCVPQSLQLYAYNYSLRGIIAFEQSSSQPSGHYVAYCWRESFHRWELYDGCCMNRKVISLDSQVVELHILFYIKSSHSSCQS